jgi:hypothetical protein
MSRNKKYTEPTGHLTKRVPKSQLKQCHKILDDHLVPFLAPPKKVEPIKTETTNANP